MVVLQFRQLQQIHRHTYPAQVVATIDDLVGRGSCGIEDGVALRMARDARQALGPHQITACVHNRSYHLCWRPLLDDTPSPASSLAAAAAARRPAAAS